MWIILSLLIIFFPVFEEFMTVLIRRLFKISSIMFLVELLGKIMYLCNRLLLEK